DDSRQNPEHLERFSQLDDFDIFTSIKVWVEHDDFILSTLCKHLIDRNLYKVEITNDPPEVEKINELVNQAIKKYNISEDDASYFVFTDTIKNNAYRAGDGSINIVMKDGSIQDIASASDNSNLEALSKTVQKHILCYTKDLILFY
ncbi:MAG TPA: phosphohydrolase, partial [Sphingobacteriaceae bacterium]|nr:phosphohydrolase [Sphingobacteriaceae bacterium]